MPSANPTDCWNDQTHSEIENETAGHLWRFIQKHSKIASPAEVFSNIVKLTVADTEKLAKAHLMMSDQTLHFLTDTAPELLRRLIKTTLSRRQTSRAGIRGRIHWPETFNKRLSEGLNPALFVTVDQSLLFDLPENRIFKFLLQKLHSTAVSFLSANETKTTILDERLLGNPVWKVRLSQIALACGKMLKNIHLQKCAGISELSPSLIKKSASSRNQHYRDLAIMAEECRLCFSSPAAYLVKYINSHVLIPLDKNILYELAVLFKILEACHGSGWHENTASLIGGGNKKISAFQKEEAELRVYYQGLPDTFENNSLYSTLTVKYGISNRLRRPDIVLEMVSFTGGKKYIIVEVKRSQERIYLADGIYKLLGYMKDYEAVVFGLHHEMAGVLVSWSGSDIISYEPGDSVYITQWTELDRLLSLILV